MPPYSHLPDRLSCPYLPRIKEVLRPSALKTLKNGTNRRAYYRETLKCAQSLWLCGLPAQALLQLNMALGESLPKNDIVYQDHPLPYNAQAWILTHRDTDLFIGNPVRHYQHLATRLTGKNKAVRSQRAWISFHIAKRILPACEYPVDLAQINKEELTIPSLSKTLQNIPTQKEQALIHSVILQLQQLY